MKIFNRILRAINKRRKKKIVVLAPNKYGESMGLKMAWTFDLDCDGLPIFHTASEKAKWEMATMEYSMMFDKFETTI